MDNNMNDSMDVLQEENNINRVTNKGVNYVFLISTVLQFMIAIILGTIVFIIIYFTKSGDETKILHYYVLPLVEISAIFLPVVFYFLITKVNYKKVLRLNSIKLKHIPALIILGISSQFVGGFLNTMAVYILQFFGNVPTQEIPAPVNVTELMYALIAIAIIPAVFEELLTRGIIMRGYEGFGIKWGIIISSILFGIMHYDVINFIFPIFLGLILGYVVYRTNSIYSGMIIHFVNNALAVFMIYFYTQPLTDYYGKISVIELLQYFGIALIAAVFVAGSVYYIFKTTSVDGYNEEVSELVEHKALSVKELLHWPIIATVAILFISFYVFIDSVIRGIQ